MSYGTDKIIEEENKKLFEVPVDVYQDNKIISAEQFWIKQPFFYDEQGLFWFWNKENKCYQIKDETTLMNSLRKAAKNAVIIKNKEWSEINRAMKLVGRDHIPKPTEKSWIQFKDKIIDWKTGQITQISHKYWNTNPIPWNCKKGSTKQINKLFEEWVGKDYVQTLKEIISYCLIQDYPLHRIFCLTGSGLNGKGVFQTLLRRIIGEANVVSTELDLLMDNRFETAKLYKKLVCQMGETNFSEISKTSMLKKLSGQDLVGIEFKNKNPFDTVNYAKMIINSNSLPPTMDKTDGFYRRWLIIDFPNKFQEGVDVMSIIPDSEIECLLGECVELLPELVKKGNFHNEGSIAERRKRYEEKSNPINVFIQEYYEKDVDAKIPIFEFEKNYNDYLKERGLRQITRMSLIRLLKSEGFDIERSDVYKNDGTRTKWTFIYGLKETATPTTPATPNPIQTLYMASKSKMVSQVSQVSQQAQISTGNSNISTGKSDISTRNEGDAMIKVNRIVKLLEKTLQFGKPIDELTLEKNCTYNNFMTKQTFYDLLNKLKMEGIIFEPKPGQWQMI